MGKNSCLGAELEFRMRSACLQGARWIPIQPLEITFAQEYGGALRNWMVRGKFLNMREEEKWTYNTVHRVTSRQEAVWVIRNAKITALFFQL